MKEWVIVFIIGSGVDKAMCVAPKGYSNEDFEYMMRAAAQAGLNKPEIIGQVDIPEHIANEMVDGRIYVG